MATVKSYTDLEQSRKLAEILPLESADMHYEWPNKKVHFKDDGYSGMGLSCWSLAALLSVLPEKYTELIKEGGMYRIIIKDSYMTCLFDNPVDACVAMIEKLHELNLL